LQIPQMLANFAVMVIVRVSSERDRPNADPDSTSIPCARLPASSPQKWA
jgi:hypothetical protein